MPRMTEALPPVWLSSHDEIDVIIVADSSRHGGHTGALLDV
ncbi:MAG: hypothetical protein ACRD40_00795 [Candidatus Acidiferrales bacterium]